MHLVAVGLVWQLSRVLSLQLVTTNIRATAKSATMPSVFMAYQATTRWASQGDGLNLLKLVDMWPMLLCLLDCLVTESSHKLQAGLESLPGIRFLCRL